MSKLNVYVYPGFGDHCIAYGIIKEYSKRYDQLCVYADIVNADLLYTRKRLYKGISNVEIMDVTFSNDRVYVVGEEFLGIANRKPWFDMAKPWIENPKLPDPEWFTDEWRFDVKWYEQAMVPFNLKWDNFDFQRDIEREKDVFYNKLGLKDNEEFIFIQEDKTRNFILKKENIRNDIKWINFSDFQDINILDALFIIEQAKEVHTFNTGMLTFVDLMNIKHESLNYHKYLRPMIFEQPILLLNWNIL